MARLQAALADAEAWAAGNATQWADWLAGNVTAEAKLWEGWLAGNTTAQANAASVAATAERCADDLLACEQDLQASQKATDAAAANATTCTGWQLPACEAERDEWREVGVRGCVRAEWSQGRAAGGRGCNAAPRRLREFTMPCSSPQKSKLREAALAACLAGTEGTQAEGTQAAGGTDELALCQASLNQTQVGTAAARVPAATVSPALPAAPHCCVLPSDPHPAPPVFPPWAQLDLEECFAVAGELAQESGAAAPTLAPAPAAQPAEGQEPARESASVRQGKPAGKQEKSDGQKEEEGAAAEAPLKAQSEEKPKRRGRRD